MEHQWPDIINASFECFGGVFVIFSIIRLHKEKMVRGISILTVIFFAAWGMWNLFYYPHLGQSLSFIGGVFVTSANTVWLGQVIYYSVTEKLRLKNAKI